MIRKTYITRMPDQAGAFLLASALSHVFWLFYAYHPSLTAYVTICGLDLLFGENGFIIGEINDSPGMKTIVEKVGMEKFLKALAI